MSCLSSGNGHRSNMLSSSLRFCNFKTVMPLNLDINLNIIDLIMSLNLKIWGFEVCHYMFLSSRVCRWY